MRAGQLDFAHDPGSLNLSLCNRDNRITPRVIALTGRRAGEFPPMDTSVEMARHRPYDIEVSVIGKKRQGHACAWGVCMPPKTKSRLVMENATLRARLAELEDKLANRPSGTGGELPERDIAERKRIDEALRASEVRYRRLFETAKDGILILDADTGRITDANPFLQDLLGYSHAELLGKMLWEIGPFRDIAASRGAFRKLQRNEYIRYDNLPLETKGRRHRHVEFISNVYLVNGKRVIQCNIRDITARHQAEVALANVSKELEKRVDERTAELLTANTLMKKMLDEGRRAAEKITSSRERLRNLSGRLQSVLEDERARISREIHDELGQALTALKLELSSTRSHLASAGLDEPSAKIREAERAVGRIIRTVRRIATELRPGILDELGVAAAIEWIGKDFQRRTGIRCNVAIRLVDKLSDPVRATALFRVVQEALTNVVRHAAASQVDVRLEKKGEDLVLHVRDNGIGIMEGRVLDAKSLGLIGMRERVMRLGGEAVISGKPGEGTIVRVTVPIGKKANPNA